MKILAGLAVVSVIGEVARRRLDTVRPVNLSAGGVQNDQTDGVFGDAALESEAALVAYWQQLADGVVPSMPELAALIDTVEHEIRGRKLREGHSYHWHDLILPGNATARCRERFVGRLSLSEWVCRLGPPAVPQTCRRFGLASEPLETWRETDCDF